MGNQPTYWINASPEALFDAWLLGWGVFPSLSGFMGLEAWDSSCASMRVNGALMPLPMTLPIEESMASALKKGQVIGLRDERARPVATVEISEVFQVDPRWEAKTTLGTLDETHPWMRKLLEWGRWRVAGRVSLLAQKPGPDIFGRWLSPKQVKASIQERGWKSVAAFQTRNPLHWAHLELIKRALAKTEGALIHPAMGVTKAGDVESGLRARCYESAMMELPPEQAMLAYAPLAMRMAGPREALHHALVRKAFGATAFIVGRDHAGPGNNAKGAPFYEPLEAQKLAKDYERELGLDILTFDEAVFSESRKRYVLRSELNDGEESRSISGTRMREMLEKGDPLPSWFTPKGVADALAAKKKKGFGLLLTGLSGAGKSALSDELSRRWLMRTGAEMSVLDGDEARKMLSSELGFSKAHRDLNVERLGFVAAQAAKHGGGCLIAAIAPYASAREKAIGWIKKEGGVAGIIHVSTSLEICESRDPKGLYQKARRGELKGFTGIDDPYETPIDADLTLDLGRLSLEEACASVESWLAERGLLG